MKPVRRHARARGFTLLELMVVVVIIGIVIAGAILSLGSAGRDSQLQQERDRLTALISYVRERGSMMTLEYGIRCGVHGYRFVYYDNRTMQWLPATLDDTLRLRKLPPGLQLQLVIEGRTIVLDDKALKFTAPAAPASAASAASGDFGQAPALAPLGAAADPVASADADARRADNAPQIMLLSNGDTNSFALTIERDSTHRSVTISSAADGSVHAGNVIQEPQ